MITLITKLIFKIYAHLYMSSYIHGVG